MPSSYRQHSSDIGQWRQNHGRHPGSRRRVCVKRAKQSACLVARLRLGNHRHEWGRGAILSKNSQPGMRRGGTSQPHFHDAQSRQVGAPPVFRHLLGRHWRSPRAIDALGLESHACRTRHIFKRLHCHDVRAGTMANPCYAVLFQHGEARGGVADHDVKRDRRRLSQARD